MQKHDARDPLAGIINKSIELAEEAAKLYHLDEKQTKMLCDEIRFRVMGDAIGIKCGNIVEKKPECGKLDPDDRYSECKYIKGDE